MILDVPFAICHLFLALAQAIGHSLWSPTHSASLVRSHAAQELRRPTQLRLEGDFLKRDGEVAVSYWKCFSVTGSKASY